ncbi:aprataxin-like [Papaver somniferum]|uniref:aprataxin-like n=1 Tax=Papaver somniferum TaxID=3469 RepID=UPI000E704306|nr:aprataxin-like [Papaver somniferum]
MREVGTMMVKRYLKLEGHKSQAIRMGFHSIPGMLQLHLHVMTQDFKEADSNHNWNKNNTSFFKDVDTCIKELEEDRQLTIPADKRKLEADPFCYRCETSYESVDIIRKHQNICPFPENVKSFTW